MYLIHNYIYIIDEMLYIQDKLHDFYSGPCAALPVEDIEYIQADIPF